MYATKNKSEKNFLFSKEATSMIIENYDDLAIKSDFLNYLMENLLEYYDEKDFKYLDNFLFPQKPSNLTDDILEKIIKDKNSVLFDYYVTKALEDSQKLEYTKKIIKFSNLNPNLNPKDLRPYYINSLQQFLKDKDIDQIDVFFDDAKKDFYDCVNPFFIIDLYNNFVIPIMQEKLKEYNISSLDSLEYIVKFINKHIDLKYSRYARTLITTFDMLSTNSGYFSYDLDIMYDVQVLVEKIMINDNIFDYNLLYFCSFFDGKVDYRKSLNLIINMLEGQNTISISRTKYQKVKEKTIQESLSYIEWLLKNHKQDTENKEFDEVIKEFINYNWNMLSSNSKIYISMKNKLFEYSNLDKVIESVKRQNMAKVLYWYIKNKTYIKSFLISFILFAITSYYATNFVISIIKDFDNTKNEILLYSVLVEVIVFGFLMIANMLITEHTPKKEIKSKNII